MPAANDDLEPLMRAVIEYPKAIAGVSSKYKQHDWEKAEAAVRRKVEQYGAWRFAIGELGECGSDGCRCPTRKAHDAYFEEEQP